MYIYIYVLCGDVASEGKCFVSLRETGAFFVPLFSYHFGVRKGQPTCTAEMIRVPTSLTFTLLLLQGVGGFEPQQSQPHQSLPVKEGVENRLVGGY